MNKIDLLGLFDIFVQIEVDLYGIFSGEVNIGIVIDTDNINDSGVSITTPSGEGGVGLNAGIAVTAGVALNELEGESLSIDVNAGPDSLQAGFDENGLNIISVGVGPGIGGSVGVTNTNTLSIQDVIDAIAPYFEQIESSLEYIYNNLGCGH